MYLSLNKKNIYIFKISADLNSTEVLGICWQNFHKNFGQFGFLSKTVHTVRIYFICTTVRLSDFWVEKNWTLAS